MKSETPTPPLAAGSQWRPPLAFAAAIASLIAIGGVARAQFVVVDPAALTQGVMQQAETIAKWADQAKQLDSQISQTKKQYEAATGSRGMGSLLNNSGLDSTLPSDWESVTASVRTTPAYASERSRYPTYTSAPKANALYDVIASQRVTTSDFYAKSSARVQQSRSLMAQIDAASDPAAKADLTNRLISEQNLIQGNQQVLATLQLKQKQELENANQAAAKEWRCKEFNSTTC
ncbi:type IV secretion system protein [Variovorax saccharolyticus]|uniref:type IV secretion system protein n=1 Tax=Variovorax saccharolyticus TaxID=3053516 RepID=UPI002574E5A7|nr:type IV secretion system protein [Variovorax sp. J31P216]MDM0029126.1 type IV secretion system protein [Variovorax sp. J31P216]